MMSMILYTVLLIYCILTFVIFWKHKTTQNQNRHMQSLQKLTV